MLNIFYKAALDNINYVQQCVFLQNEKKELPNLNRILGRKTLPYILLL